MHPVIRHILDRRGKKVPVHDGRKITLVLYSGIMTGVRGAGAMIALEDLGLSHAFDEIQTVSAGFANASYLLGDNTRPGTSIYYDDLAGGNFIKPWRIWKMADINFVVHATEVKKPLNVEAIKKTHTKLYVRLLNVSTRKNEYLEIHDLFHIKYHDILKAAIYMQYMAPGTVSINGTRYMDGWFTSNDSIEFVNHALASDATDILIIYNRRDQRAKEIPLSDRVCEILPEPEWKLSSLETNSEKLKHATIQMGTLVKKTFGIDEPISLAYNDARVSNFNAN